MKKIGFFGLGNMGLPMALNLVKKGYQVTGFDLNSEALNSFKENGGSIARSPLDAVKGQNVVVTMLPNGEIVKKLYLGEQGILTGADLGTLFIDCSTIAAKDAKTVATEAAEKGLEIIDAPVSGGTAGAQGGTLTFIVGGEKSVVEKSKTILGVMGTTIHHAGPNGSGQVAKICNNMLLAIHMIGSAEALNLGIAHNLDPKVLSEIMKSSSGNNWSLQKYNPVPHVMDGTPSSNNYEGGFGSTLMLKDLGLSQEAKNNTETSTPLGALATELFSKHCEGDGKNKDFSSIIQFLRTFEK